jgi:hypothetical protein
MGSSNGDRGRLNGGRIQGLVDRSHEGEGQYRLYGTDQFTCHPQAGAPRRWASTPAGHSQRNRRTAQHEAKAEELVGL